MKRILIAAAALAVGTPAWAAGPGGIRTEPSVKTSQTLKCTIYGSIKGTSLLSINNTTGQTIPQQAIVEVRYWYRNGVQPMFHIERLPAARLFVSPGAYPWKPGVLGGYATIKVAQSCSARVFMSPYTR